jgi:hypothetical protein
MENRPISPVSVVFLSRLANGAGEVRRNASPSTLWRGPPVSTKEL